MNLLDMYYLYGQLNTLTYQYLCLQYSLRVHLSFLDLLQFAVEIKTFCLLPMVFSKTHSCFMNLSFALHLILVNLFN